MKKVLLLALHRTLDGELVKDGGPALAREVVNALKRKNCHVDFMSGNMMPPSKQYTHLSPFFQRIYKAKDFAQGIDKKIFDEYDTIFFFHPSTLMGFEAKDLPLGKLFLFPTLLGKEYAKFMEVPEEYIVQEKKILSYGFNIQCPSHVQEQILLEDYGVSPQRILVHPRGFSPELFVPHERCLRKDISPERPLRIMSANALRPQKGYTELIPTVKYCTENSLPIKVIIYGDTERSTNASYLAYIKDVITTIKEAGLEPYFEFHPALEQEALSREMEKVDLAIVPSLYESFGKTALEASGSGLPTVVFNDVDVYREFLDDTTAIFSSRTPHGLYEALLKVISDDSYYHQLSVAGIENGKKYLSTKIYDDLIARIETILK